MPTDTLGTKLKYADTLLSGFEKALNYPFPMQLLAVTTILQGCTPGGSTSNFYAYFTRGDVALSVCMTMCSTLCAFFMMPFLLWAYGSQALGISVDSIPIKDMIMQLMDQAPHSGYIRAAKSSSCPAPVEVSRIDVNLSECERPSFGTTRLG